MTFEEWWKEKALKMMVLNYGAEEIAHDAWQAAQPKWTMCKDGMPDKTVNCLCLNKYGYVSIDSYRENIHFMQDIIAWMPLPEVPNVHD